MWGGTTLSMPQIRDFISCLLLHLCKSRTLRMYWTLLWSAPSPRPVKSNIQCIPSMTIVSISQRGSDDRVYLPSSNSLASFLPYTQLILTEMAAHWDTWASAHLRSISFSSHPLWFNFEQLPSSSSNEGAGSAVAWDPRLRSECVIQLKHCDYSRNRH